MILIAITGSDFERLFLSSCHRVHCVVTRWFVLRSTCVAIRFRLFLALERWWRSAICFLIVLWSGWAVVQLSQIEPCVSSISSKVRVIYSLLHHQVWIFQEAKPHEVDSWQEELHQWHSSNSHRDQIDDPCSPTSRQVDQSKCHDHVDWDPDADAPCSVILEQLHLLRLLLC